MAWIKRAVGTAPTTPTSIWAGKKANFMGDSITEAGGHIAYHQVLQTMLGFSICRNYGISGTAIGQNLGVSMNNRVQTMDADADIIFVMGGTNDFGHSVPMGVNFTTDGAGLRTPNTDTNSFYGALHTMSKRLIARYPMKKIVYIAPIHRADSLDFTDWQKNGQNLYFQDYINAIREVAQWYSIPVLDLWATSGIAAGESAHDPYLDGRIHPTDLGHQKIAETIASFINAHYLNATFS